METRNQSFLAVSVGRTQSFISRLSRGDKHASYPVACRLAAITGSKPDIWQRGGGTPEQRQQALANWEQQIT